MYKAVGTALTPSGGALSGASVYVYLAGTTTLATIYSDNGVTTKTNPVTTDAQGAWSFYVADGRYDLSVQKTGYTTVTVTDQLYEDPVDASVINASTLTATTATIGTLTATSPNFTAVGVGGTPTTAIGIHHRGSSTGATTAYGMLQNNTVQSDVTSSYRGIQISTGTQATSFTLSNLYGTLVSQATFGAGSTVTNQYGHYVDSSMTGAVNNYGFYGNLPSGAGRYNFYAAGTADNYFAGAMQIPGVLRRGVSPSLQLTVGGANNQGIQNVGAGESRYVSARHSADANGGAIFFAKSRNATPGSFTIVNNADNIANIAGYADDGAGLNARVADITFNVDGPPATGSVPGNIVFGTTKPGNSGTSEAGRFASSGNLLIGTSTDTAGYKLQVAGSVILGGGVGGDSFRVINVASAVNRIEAIGAVTGQAVMLRAQGTDANIDLSLNANGSGFILKNNRTRTTSKTINNTASLSSITLTTEETYLTNGTVAGSLAVTLYAASASIDGARVLLSSTTTRNSVTWASSGATVVGAPSTLTANTPVALRYDHASMQWLITL